MRPARPFIVLLLLVGLALWGLPTAAEQQRPGQPPAAPGQIDPRLAAEAEAAGPDDRIQALLILASPPTERGPRDEVVAQLQRVAAQAQEQVERRIEERHELDVALVNRFWIQNMLLVDLPARSLDDVARLPRVRRVIPNFVLTRPEPVPVQGPGGSIVDGVTWGLDRIEADRVWEELGITGSGVRVATLDTGVDISHQDLVGRMVTDDPGDPTFPGGWMEFDSQGNLVSSQPHETDGLFAHGTHVSGTVQGGDASDVAIGVAPDAEMMHGLVIPGGSGSFAQVAAGMEWTVEPTDADGNPAGAPADVVNMSLGAEGFFDEMIEPTRNMYFAGVFPSFAIGNNCLPGGTASPGNVFEAVGIGATDDAEQVAGFSCGGEIDADDWGDPPSDWPDSYIKPDLSAPGVDVWSAGHGPDSYRFLSGTSMAAPHVAGTVALMRSAAPELTVDAIVDVLEDTAFIPEDVEVPDTGYGMGRINAFEATALVALESGITGTVTDADTGTPITGAQVHVVETGATVRTDDSGSYTLRLPADTYTLEVSAFGYHDTGIDDIAVEEDTFTTIDVTLDPLPTGAVEGTVTFAPSGQGVPGVHVLLDAPVTLDDHTDTNGDYHITDIPIGTYTLTADPTHFPPPDPIQITIQEDTTTTADLELQPAASVAVLGDQAGTIAAFLDDNGFDVEEHSWDSLGDVAEYAGIVVNRPGNPGEDDFLGFIDATDAAGTGVLLLDTWSTLGNGIWLLWQHVGIPSERSTGFSSGIDYLYYEVTVEHPVLDGFEVGDEVILDEVTTFKDHAWFDGYEGEDREVIALAARDDDGVQGPGVGVQERDNNRHALLSMHAASAFIDPTDWHDDGAQVFLNALDWVAPAPDPDDPMFVEWDLSVDPDVVLGGEPVDVSVQVTNVGGSSGDHDVVLRIDGDIEDTTTVTLGVGETTDVEWTVTRDEIGSYQVQVGPLTDTFRVRPPIVALSASTVEGPDHDAQPLAGATVELVEDGARTPVGVTDIDGELTFESTDAVATYTIVVRHADAVDGNGYLLTREVTIDDDTQVVFAPQTQTDGIDDDQQAALVDLALDAVDDAHVAFSYLRSEATAPFGYGYTPGPVVATVDSYQVVHTHTVTRPERDHWYVTEPIDGLDFVDPDAFEHGFGGQAAATLDVAPTSGTEFIARWDANDDHGHPFEVMLATELRPFTTPPDVLELEDIADTIRGDAPNETEIVLRLSDPDGDIVHAGGVTWDQRTIQRDLADLVDDIAPGTYTLDLDIDTGPYSNHITATNQLTMPIRHISESLVRPRQKVDIEVTFSAPDAGDVSLTEVPALAGDDPDGWPDVWIIDDWSTSAPADMVEDGVWTFHADDLTPGEELTVTYTLRSSRDIDVPSDWTLHGHTTLHHDDTTLDVGGDTDVRVRHRPDQPGRPGGGGR